MSVSGAGSEMRLMTCGHATVVVGSSRDRFFTGLKRGGLAQFRHQLFLVCLIAHVHKAALLAKTDLTTELVKEFTELQGIVGGLYAKAQGLDPAIGDAIPTVPQ